MATFRTRNGKTQVQVRRQGSAPVTRTFTSRKDAEEWAREMERQADRRGLPVSPAVLDRTTLAQVLERFGNEVVPTTKSAEVDTYIINAFLRRPLGYFVESEWQTDVVSAMRFTVCGQPPYSNCVIDGDTFYFGTDAIRIADIDTPETHEPRCEYEAALGAQATRRLS